MFSALIEATTPEASGRKAGDRHMIVAVVDDDEQGCASRAVAELKARGWTAIDVKRIGPVVESEPTARPTYIAGAVADAGETGFGPVVYEKPIKAN